MNAPLDFQSKKLKRLAKLGLELSEFEEKFARSSGPGGQNVNKVSTCVQLRHVPTGVGVSVQDSRSQSMNRQLAWTRLLDQIERQRKEEKAARRAEAEKERRQKAKKRPRGVQKRILEGKRRRGDVKRLRAKDF